MHFIKNRDLRCVKTVLFVLPDAIKDNPKLPSQAQIPSPAANFGIFSLFFFGTLSSIDAVSAVLWSVEWTKNTFADICLNNSLSFFVSSKP